MPLPLIPIFVALSAGKLVVDVVQGGLAIEEINRQQREAQEAIRQRQKDELRNYKLRSGSRRAALQSLLGETSVAFAAGGIAGGATPMAVGASLAAGASMSEMADRISLQSLDRSLGRKAEGISRAASAARTTEYLKMTGSFLGTGADVAFAAETSGYFE